ncbi:hypothetical protein ABWH91_01400 [Phycisphaerales bacterium ac7]
MSVVQLTTRRISAPAIGRGQLVSIGIGTITAAIGSTTISMSTISARSGFLGRYWLRRVIGNSTHAPMTARKTIAWQPKVNCTRDGMPTERTAKIVKSAATMRYSDQYSAKNRGSAFRCAQGSPFRLRSSGTNTIGPSRKPRRTDSPRSSGRSAGWMYSLPSGP